MASFEYEVRLTDADGAPLCAPLSYSFGELAPFDHLAAELDRAFDAMGIELSALHTEAGPGLLEINLAPRRGLLAADEAMLVKAAVKDVARSLGLSASFLAKTVPEEEGSSGHLHLSLWDGAGNVFAGGLAGRAGSIAAGVLGHLPGASLLYNPNLNSYKRLVPGYFAPVNVSWGEQNRSAALRAITTAGDEATARLELRRPGADANPYLVLAGALASVVLGLREGGELPPATPGDATEADPGDAAPLPASLEAAIAAFADDQPLREVLGADFASYYETSRRWELRAWQRAVTAWERERYIRTA
jgi:glutamine synthetase